MISVMRIALSSKVAFGSSSPLTVCSHRIEQNTTRATGATCTRRDAAGNEFGGHAFHRCGIPICIRDPDVRIISDKLRCTVP